MTQHAAADAATLPKRSAVVPTLEPGSHVHVDPLASRGLNRDFPKPKYRVVRFTIPPGSSGLWYVAFGQGWSNTTWTPILNGNNLIISQGPVCALIHLHMESIGFEEDTTPTHYHGGSYEPEEVGLSI